MNIGLALSGGGTRAGVFHIGVLKYLAEQKLLENIKYISTVSGGSLLVALIFKLNNYIWPSSDSFLNVTLPKLEEIYTSVDYHHEMIVQFVKNPFFLLNRQVAIKKVLYEKFNLYENFQDLPDSPLWAINANTLETGKSWRFSKKHMGDYKIGYVNTPDFSLTDAVTTSMSFPFIINSYELDTRNFSWKKYKTFDSEEQISVTPSIKKLHLQDGGMYENLGCEALFKNDKLRPEIDKIVVSDASAPLGMWTGAYSLFGVLKRQGDILSDQVRSLRTRDLVKFLKNNPGLGCYVKLGAACEAVNPQLPTELAAYPTDLKKFDKDKLCVFELYSYLLTKQTFLQYPLSLEDRNLTDNVCP